MEHDEILDLSALHTTADGSPAIKRDLLMLYLGTAEQCLRRMQASVVLGHTNDWNDVMAELRDASLRVHATQLAAICTDAADSGANARSRMSAYLELKDAYDRLISYLRTNNVLNSPKPSGIAS
jgi:hypothetical protein